LLQAGRRDGAGTGSLTPAAEWPGAAGHADRRRGGMNLFRRRGLPGVGCFFLAVLAMARFSLAGATLGTWSLTAWKADRIYSGDGIPTDQIDRDHLEVAVIPVRS